MHDSKAGIVNVAAYTKKENTTHQVSKILLLLSERNRL